jgi:hypothetical protein
MNIFGLSLMAVLALQAAPQQQAPPQTGTGVIRGRVLQAGGTQPIDDAAITLTTGTVGGGGARGQRGGGPGPAELPRVAVSDREGNFEFRDLPSGRYTAVAQRRGFSGPWFNAPDPSVSAAVVNGQTVRAEIFMTPTGVVRGRVRDASGQFASNVQVEALVIAYNSGLPSLMPAISKTSDDRGEYRLFGLPPGDYYIGATPRPASAIVARAGGDRSVKTFHPNAFDISQATKITIHGGEDIQNIDIAIQTPQMFKISGTVSTTVPVAAAPPSAQGAFAVIQQNNNATVQLILSSRDLIKPEGGNSGGTSASVTGTAPGPFEIQNVLPGSYDLVAIFNGNTPAPAIARTVVDVRNQDASGLVMTIRDGFVITGSATIDESAPQRGAVRMAFTPADGLRRMGVAVPANFAPDGSFTIPGAPDGRFRLSVAPLGPDLYVDDMRQSGVSIFDSGFEIRGRNPDPIQVLIKSGAGSLEGTVQDASGKLLNSAVVALVPATRRENDALYYSTRSDVTGSFSLRGIAPGDYKLFSWEVMPQGAHYNAAFLEKYEERGLPITIGAGAKLTSKVTVIPR